MNPISEIDLVGQANYLAIPSTLAQAETAQRPEIWLLMKSRVSLDLVSVSPLVVFNCILGIIQLVAGLLLRAPIVPSERLDDDASF